MHLLSVMPAEVAAVMMQLKDSDKYMQLLLELWA
jgi:hypothetical protein